MDTKSPPYNVSDSAYYRSMPKSSRAQGKTDHVITESELEVQGCLLQHIHDTDPNHGARVALFNSIDCLMYKYINDGDKREAIAALEKKITEQGKLSYLPTPDPLAMARCEDLIAYIVDTFIFRDPLFNVPTIPNMEHVTTAMEDYMRRQSNLHSWRAELTNSVHSSVWYNFGPTMLDSNSSSGVAIKSLDPFNVRYDTSVKLEHLASKALMACTTEEISVVQALEEIHNISKAYLTNWGNKAIGDPYKIMEASDMYQGLGVIRPTKYKRDKMQDTNSKSNVNWAQRDENGGKLKLESAVVSAGTVERTFLFRRMNPSWFKLNPDVYQDDTSGKTTVYKIYFLGGTMISIEPLTESPYKIPLYVGSCFMDSSGGTPYTFAERLKPAQEYNDKLNDARLVGLKSSLKKTVAVDENLCDITPEGTVKVKSKARVDSNFSIDQAYKEYRNDPAGLNQLLSFSQEMDSLVSNATGDNQMLQGKHIPGNRTAPESQRLLKTSQARVVLRSFAFQATLIEPLQQDIQGQMGKNVGSLKYYEGMTGSIMAVTSEEYTIAQHFFDIADGLLPSSMEINPESAQALMTMVVQVPALQQIFDLKTLTVLFAISLGMKGVNKIPSPSVAQRDIQDRLQALAQKQQGEQGAQGAQGAPAPQGGDGGAGAPPDPNAPPQTPNTQGQPKPA